MNLPFQTGSSYYFFICSACVKNLVLLPFANPLAHHLYDHINKLVPLLIQQGDKYFAVVLREPNHEFHQLLSPHKNSLNHI